ncbi:MAG: hypothetical protein OIF47_13940 [Marinibacterium sp.]|nr:hypothetical protein [Marinibacterium sp.]
MKTRLFLWQHCRMMICTLIACLTTLAAPALAQTCALPDLRTDDPPGNGAPVDVGVGMIVLDVMGVEDVSQQIEIDLSVYVTWTDERLIGMEGCRLPATSIWTPHLRLVNSSNLRLAFINARDQVTIRENGEVHYAQRGTGRISSYHSLRRFPFDRHNFDIRLTPVVSERTTINLIPDVENTWIANRLNVEGWTMSGVSIAAGDYILRDGAAPFKTVALTIRAERNPEFFVYRVLVLLFLVVGMSWVIFWVPPSRFEFQIGIGATAMLTAIAFNLALSGQLPPVGYLTILDKMMVWAIFLVFLSIIEALIAGRMVMKGREKEALAIDRACRIVFPVLLLGGWLGLVLT